MEGYTEDVGHSLADRGKIKGKRRKIKKKMERKIEMKTKKSLILYFFNRGLLFEQFHGFFKVHR